jgi:hypothetical protein
MLRKTGIEYGTNPLMIKEPLGKPPGGGLLDSGYRVRFMAIMY